MGRVCLIDYLLLLTRFPTVVVGVQVDTSGKPLGFCVFAPP